MTQSPERYAHLDSPIHRLDARWKIVVALLFTVAVVSTPAELFLAFGGYALVLAALVALSRLPPLHVLSRLALVLPFVAAVAIFIPFLPAHGPAGGYNLGVGGLRVSHSGLLVFWNVVAKSLLGAGAAILLTATTPFATLTRALTQLKMPRLLVLILSMAYRYLFVLADEAQRMLRARDSRCYRGRWLWHAAAVGDITGALFLRSYERGERVYLAMAALEPATEAAPACSADGEKDARVGAHSLLEIKDLSFTYPDGSPALRGISLAIAAGERVALVGANGAGKSTLLLHLNGIIESAAVTVSGLPATRANLKAIRQKVGLVFQNPDDQLFCATVAEDVAFGPRNLRLAESEIAERVRESLREVGLQGFERRSAFHLSVGEKKRAALATVLAMRPDVIVLDEPTGELDPRGRRELAALLRRIGRTQIVATHDFELARELCSRVVVLDKGTLVADGTVADVLGDHTLLAAHGLA
jgi:cobalt/nickel transport system permease protein